MTVIHQMDVRRIISTAVNSIETSTTAVRTPEMDVRRIISTVHNTIEMTQRATSNHQTGADIIMITEHATEEFSQDVAEETFQAVAEETSHRACEGISHVAGMMFVLQKAIRWTVTVPIIFQDVADQFRTIFVKIHSITEIATADHTELVAGLRIAEI